MFDSDGVYVPFKETFQLEGVDDDADLVHIVADDACGVALVVEHGGEEHGLVGGGAAAAAPDLGGGGVGVAEVGGMDVVEVDVVDHEVADGGDALEGFASEEVGGGIVGFGQLVLVEFGRELGDAVEEAQGGDDVGGHIGLAGSQD